MSRGDGRKDPADRPLPPQAAGMSCHSMAEEIMPGHANFLVVDAVLRNRSLRTKFPANRAQWRRQARGCRGRPNKSPGARLVETVGMGLASEQPGGAPSRDGMPLESCPAKCVAPAFETSHARGLFWRLARAKPISPTWSTSPSPKRRLTPLLAQCLSKATASHRPISEASALSGFREAWSRSSGRCDGAGRAIPT
jgi:hypothetical protein